MQKVVVGLDPGGAGPRSGNTKIGKFGWAVLEASGPVKVPNVLAYGTSTGVESVVNDVINAVAKKGAVVVGLGIDSLLSSDHRAWRNVDLWLRAQYPSSKPSIVSFHSAYGPLAIGGADAACLLATQYQCVISESHPAVILEQATKKNLWTHPAVHTMSKKDIKDCDVCCAVLAGLSALARLGLLDAIWGSWLDVYSQAFVCNNCHQLVQCSPTLRRLPHQYWLPSVNKAVANSVTCSRCSP